MALVPTGAGTLTQLVESATGCERLTAFTDQGSGSGFVISTNGYSVTNHHVTEGAKRVHVAGQDGKKVTARVVDSNESRDLAILKVDECNWAPVELADMDTVGIGDTVFAIGSPGAIDTLLQSTVTRGIVSGIREFPTPIKGKANAKEF